MYFLQISIFYRVFWLYQDFSTKLKKTDRIKLQEYYTIKPLKIVVQQQSKDGTVKFLFQLADGYKIETVLMPQNYGNSVCVTTQVGM